MNIYYIQAAVLAKTGIRVKIPELKSLLFEEELITKATYDKIIENPNVYRNYYDSKPVKGQEDDDSSNMR